MSSTTTRIGMRKFKDTGIDPDAPFYYNAYDPKNPQRGFARNMYITGPSRSFYGRDEDGRRTKNVWMETDAEIVPSISPSSSQMRTIIHFERTPIYSNAVEGTDIPICTVEIDGVVHYCDEVIIDGPSQFFYDENHTPAAWIVTNSNVTMIGERIAYIP